MERASEEVVIVREIEGGGGERRGIKAQIKNNVVREKVRSRIKGESEGREREYHINHFTFIILYALCSCIL